MGCVQKQTKSNSNTYRIDNQQSLKYKRNNQNKHQGRDEQNCQSCQNKVDRKQNDLCQQHRLNTSENTFGMKQIPEQLSNIKSKNNINTITNQYNINQNNSKPNFSMNPQQKIQTINQQQKYSSPPRSYLYPKIESKLPSVFNTSEIELGSQIPIPQISKLHIEWHNDTSHIKPVSYLDNTTLQPKA